MTTPDPEQLKDTLDLVETNDLISALVRRFDHTIIITTNQPHLSIPKYLFALHYGNVDRESALQILTHAFTTTESVPTSNFD